MNKDIIQILEKSEEIKFEMKSIEDYKYYFIKGLYGKVFLLCEESENLEETLKIVEKICISDKVLKDMWPQFIYVVIISDDSNNFKGLTVYFYKLQVLTFF